MLFSKYILKDRLIRLDRLNNKIKEGQEDITTEKGTLYSNIYDIRLGLQECVESHRVPMIYNLMINGIKGVQERLSNVKTALELKALINDITTMFDGFDFEEYNYSDMKGDYLSTSTFNDLDAIAIDPLRDVISNTHRNINVFEDECGSGDWLDYISQDYTNVLTYGTEESSCSSIAKGRITRLGKGPLKGSKISNDAFDILIAKCRIKRSLDGNIGFSGAVAKAEKVYILNIKKYLRKDGIILFAIPYYRMHKDICQHIAKYYDDIQVYRTNDDSWTEHKLVYIYGKKSSNNDMDDEAYKLLRRCYSPDNIQVIADDTKLGYTLPMTFIDIDLFKGSILDMDELNYIVDHSGALDTFFEEQKVEKIGESTTRPLLPFNIGQVGLVLTSGCLDGIIDEGDGHYHLVKGKVSKKRERKREVSDGVCNEQETISNRVEINVLLPNGEFKVLN